MADTTDTEATPDNSGTSGKGLEALVIKFRQRRMAEEARQPSLYGSYPR